MNEEKKTVGSLLKEIAEMIYRELEKHKDEVEKIASRLEVTLEEYKALMVAEIVQNSEIFVGAQFAFPPAQTHTPEDLKNKALKLFEKKLRRDCRLYLTA